MRVALIQLNAKEDKYANILKAEGFVHRAIEKKAEFILLPEVFVFRGRMTEAVAEKIPGESIRPLMILAKKYGVFILAGSVYEKNFRRPKGIRVYNTSVLINPQGRVQVKYRKINLFNAIIEEKRIQESSLFIPGRRMVITKVRGFQAGLSICYDLRFPQMYQKYAQLGADILCIPAAFTRQTGRDHWEVLLRARAIENACYVLAPNQTGKDGRGVWSYGNSMVIDPWGKIIARASEKQEELIFARIERKVLMEKRSILGRVKNG